MGVFGDILSGVMDAGNFALSMGPRHGRNRPRKRRGKGKTTQSSGELRT